MPDEQQFVPLVDFSTTVKLLLGQILDLSSNIMVLRQAMMQQSSLPVPAEELQRLHNFFQNDFEPFRQARHALDQVHTSIEIAELLRIYKLSGQ